MYRMRPRSDSIVADVHWNWQWLAIAALCHITYTVLRCLVSTVAMATVCNRLHVTKRKRDWNPHTHTHTQWRSLVSTVACQRVTSCDATQWSKFALFTIEMRQASSNEFVLKNASVQFTSSICANYSYTIALVKCVSAAKVPTLTALSCALNAALTWFRSAHSSDSISVITPL